jgi:hypothetical protein
MSHKTRVIKYGAFWCVAVFHCNQWMRMRDLYVTRNGARAGRVYWSNY